MTAVILVGSRDFGRCPLATSLHRSLWPVFDRPMLECQLVLLAREDVGSAVVSATESALVEEAVGRRMYGAMPVSFVADRMPRGPAGSLRDALEGTEGGAVIVIEGAAWVADARALVEAHRRGGAALTVFVTGGPGGEGAEARSAGIYVCEREVINFVASAGYQDIKEQLIPALLREGLAVRAAALPWQAAGGRGVEGYLSVIERALRTPGEFGISEDRFQRRGADILISPAASVSESARIVGPVAILEGARIADGAVVAGPAVIGRGAEVGAGAVVDASVLWENASAGRGAVVTASVVGRGARVRPGAVVERAAVARSAVKGATVGDGMARSARTSPAARHARRARVAAGAVAVAAKEAAGAPLAVVGAVVAAAFLWSYWSVFQDLWRVWRDNDNYSSGILVPILAAYVAFTRRRELGELDRRPYLWGMGIVLAGFAMRFAGSMLLFASAERLSVIVVAAGLVVTLFGVGVARRMAWVMAFLLLMLPWPNRVYNPASLWLQNWAVGSSVFLLETFGWVVSREGNSVLHVGTATVQIAEACNGLRMLTAFMVVSGLVAFVSGRGRHEKGLIFVSSIPIAVVCNTVRLTATAIAFSAGYGERTNQFFHDFGGIAMMPLALGMMAGELWLIRRLFVAEEVAETAAGAEREARGGAARP